MPTFPGFPREGLAFLRQLKKNNQREWFQPRKETFDTKVKAPMAALVSALNAELARAAPDHVTEPESAIYRIYRDTRFSNDKTPYKTHIAATFRHRVLGKHNSAGFYVGVSPFEVEVAGGVYMPEAAQILTLRTLFAERYEEFRKLTGARGFRALLGDVQGEQLVRMPKGFAAGHAAEDLLRRKQWYWYVTLDPAIATTPKLLMEVKKRFLAMVPAIHFLNAPLVAKQKKAARGLF